MSSISFSSTSTLSPGSLAVSSTCEPDRSNQPARASSPAGSPPGPDPCDLKVESAQKGKKKLIHDPSEARRFLGSFDANPAPCQMATGNCTVPGCEDHYQDCEKCGIQHTGLCCGNWRDVALDIVFADARARAEAIRIADQKRAEQRVPARSRSPPGRVSGSKQDNKRPKATRAVGVAMPDITPDMGDVEAKVQKKDEKCKPDLMLLDTTDGSESFIVWSDMDRFSSSRRVALWVVVVGMILILPDLPGSYYFFPDSGGNVWFWLVPRVPVLWSIGNFLAYFAPPVSRARFFCFAVAAVLCSLVSLCYWCHKRFLTPEVERFDDYGGSLPLVRSSFTNPQYCPTQFVVDWRRLVVDLVLPTPYAVRRVTLMGVADGKGMDREFYEDLEHFPDMRCYIANTTKLVKRSYQTCIIRIEDFEKDQCTYYEVPVQSLHSCMINIDMYKSPGLANNYAAYAVRQNTGLNQDTYSYASSIAGCGHFAECVKMNRRLLTQDDNTGIALNGVGGRRKIFFWVLAIAMLTSPVLLNQCAFIRESPSLFTEHPVLNVPYMLCSSAWDQLSKMSLPQFLTSETSTQFCMDVLEGSVSRLQSLGATCAYGSASLFESGSALTLSLYEQTRSWASGPGWTLLTTLKDASLNYGERGISGVQSFWVDLPGYLEGLSESVGSARQRLTSVTNPLVESIAERMASSALLDRWSNLWSKPSTPPPGLLSMFLSMSVVIISAVALLTLVARTWRLITRTLNLILRRN